MFNLHHTSLAAEEDRDEKEEAEIRFGIGLCMTSVRSMWIRHIILLSSHHSLRFLWIHEQLLITLQVCDSQYGIGQYIESLLKKIKRSRNRKIRGIVNNSLLRHFSQLYISYLSKVQLAPLQTAHFIIDGLHWKGPLKVVSSYPLGTSRDIFN